MATELFLFHFSLCVMCFSFPQMFTLPDPSMNREEVIQNYFKFVLLAWKGHRQVFLPPIHRGIEGVNAL